MAYGIIRIQKHTSFGSIKRAGKHKDREQVTPNADPLKTPENVTEGAKNSSGLVQAVQGRVNLATVKSGGENKPVLAVEYLITASPEFFSASPEKVDAYFEDAKKWLKAKHGADNVVSITRHNDEKTPHLSAFVVPLVERAAGTRKRSVIIGKDDEGKAIRETREFAKPAEISLSARHYFGGSKDVLSEFQTEFHEKVSKNFGLERGIKGSRAKHIDVKAWYAGIDKPIEQVEIKPELLKPKIIKKSFFVTETETERMVAERVAKTVGEIYEPMLKNAQNASLERRRAEEMQKTTNALDTKLKRFESLNKLAFLDKAKFESLIEQAGVEVEKIIRQRHINRKGQKR